MRKLFFASALLLALNSGAQVFHVEVTEQMKKASIDMMIPIGKNYIQVHPEYNKTVLPYGLGLRSVRDGFTVRKLNSNLDVIASREARDDEKKYGPQLYQSYTINDKIYLVFRELSSDNILGSIKMSRIDTATLAFTEEKELIPLDDKKYKETFYNFFQSDDSEVKFRLRKSKSGNYNLLFCEVIGGKKNIQERKKIMAAVFDKNMQLVYEKQHEFDVVNKGFGLHSYLIDDFGKIMLVYSKVTEIPGAKKKEKIITDTVHIVQFGPGKTEIIDQVLPMKDWIASDITLLQLPVSGDLMIAGTYSSEYGGPKVGVFRAKMSKGSATPAPSAFHPFPGNIIAQFETEKMIVQGTKAPGLTPEFAGWLHSRDGDNYDMILEYNTNVTRHLTKTTVTTYYSGSILNVYFQDDKVIYTRIPKYATHNNTNGALSSNHVVYKQNRVFLYNDDKDNLEKELTGKPSSLKDVKDAVLVAAIVKPDGTVTRQVLAEPGDNFTASVLAIDRSDPLKLYVPMEKFKTMGFSGKRRYLVITLK